MEQICLRDVRKEIDKNYVGFAPNGNSVKPVHIAGGALRCIYGKYNQTMNIKRLALVSDSKGNIPAGNDIDTIYAGLLDKEKIEESVTKTAVDAMRNVMQRLLSVDKGVYVLKGLKDGMISYSAGSKYFLTKPAMYEETGEFVGSIIKSYCPELADYIKGLLERSDDPTTILFEPVLEEDMVIFTSQNGHSDLPAFKDFKENVKEFANGIKEAGRCLKDNLSNHPNPLTQLRIFNLFCIFTIIRYMTLLEAFYCADGIKRPILLDFSGKSPTSSSIARASEMAYTQIYKSINRFYALRYAKWLETRGFKKKELSKSKTPIYEKNKPAPKNIEELNALWDLAKEKASTADGDEMYLAFGETMYDMLAIEASSHPVVYLKALGTSSGILYPPDRFHPNKRFAVSQDILEMLLRCCVAPNEVISDMDIRKRLWDRFGIVVGGSQFEMKILQSSGMILQIDEDALEENFSLFAQTLKSMDFAEVMADGILQIRMGGIEK